MIIHFVEIHRMVEEEGGLRGVLNAILAAYPRTRIIACEPEVHQLFYKLYPQTEYIAHLFTENEDSDLYYKDIVMTKHFEEALFKDCVFRGQPLKGLGFLDKTFKFRNIFWIFEMISRIKKGSDTDSVAFISSYIRFPEMSRKEAGEMDIKRYYVAPSYLRWLQKGIERTYNKGVNRISLYIMLREALLMRNLAVLYRIEKKYAILQKPLFSWVRKALKLIFMSHFLTSPCYFKQEIKDDARLDEEIRKMVPENTGKRRALLVVTNTSSHIYLEPVKPLVRALLKIGIDCRIIVEAPEIIGLMDREIRHLCTGFSDIISKSAHEHFKESAPRIYGAITEERKKYDPLSVENMILYQYFNRLPEIMSAAYLSISQQNVFMEEFRPDCAILLPDRTMHGQVAAEWCRRKGIPSVTYTVVLIKDHACYSWYYADHIFTCGSYYTEVLQKMGVPSSSIRVVGDLRYDNYAGVDSGRERSKFIETTGIDPHLPILVLAVHTLYYNCKSWVKELMKVISQANASGVKYQLYIKPHPAEKIEDYTGIMPSDPKGIFIGQDAGLERAVTSCDILLTDVSNAGLMAVYFDKPMAVVNFAKEPYPIRYDLEGVALLIERQDEIIPVIERLLHSDETKEMLSNNRSAFVRKFLYKNDGDAGKRFAEKVTELIAAGKLDKDEVLSFSGVV